MRIKQELTNKLRYVLWTVAFAIFSLNFAGVSVATPTNNEGIPVIAFANPGEKQSLSIFLANAQGQVVRQLTHGTSRDWFPAWSPDGKSIAYTSDKGSAQRTYGVKLKVYSFVELSDAGVAATEFRDRKIHPMRRGVAQVWIMDADGSNQRQLTFEGANA